MHKRIIAAFLAISLIVTSTVGYAAEEIIKEVTYGKVITLDDDVDVALDSYENIDTSLLYDEAVSNVVNSLNRVNSTTENCTINIGGLKISSGDTGDISGTIHYGTNSDETNSDGTNAENSDSSSTSDILSGYTSESFTFTPTESLVDELIEKSFGSGISIGDYESLVNLLPDSPSQTYETTVKLSKEEYEKLIEKQVAELKKQYEEACKNAEDNNNKEYEKVSEDIRARTDEIKNGVDPDTHETYDDESWADSVYKKAADMFRDVFDKIKEYLNSGEFTAADSATLSADLLAAFIEYMLQIAQESLANGDYNLINGTVADKSDYANDELVYNGCVNGNYTDILYKCSKCGAEYGFNQMCNCDNPKYLNGTIENNYESTHNSWFFDSGYYKFTDNSSSINDALVKTEDAGLSDGIIKTVIKCGLCGDTFTQDNLDYTSSNYKMFYFSENGDWICEDCLQYFDDYYKTIDNNDGSVKYYATTGTDGTTYYYYENDNGEIDVYINSSNSMALKEFATFSTTPFISVYKIVTPVYDDIEGMDTKEAIEYYLSLIPDSNQADTLLMLEAFYEIYDKAVTPTFDYTLEDGNTLITAVTNVQDQLSDLNLDDGIPISEFYDTAAKTAEEINETATIDSSLTKWFEETFMNIYKSYIENEEYALVVNNNYEVEELDYIQDTWVDPQNAEDHEVTEDYRDILFKCHTCGEYYGFAQTCNCGKYLDGTNIDKIEVYNQFYDLYISESGSKISCSICGTKQTTDNYRTLNFYYWSSVYSGYYNYDGYICENCLNKYYQYSEDDESYIPKNTASLYDDYGIDNVPLSVYEKDGVDTEVNTKHLTVNSTVDDFVDESGEQLSLLEQITGLSIDDYSSTANWQTVINEMISDYLSGTIDGSSLSDQMEQIEAYVVSEYEKLMAEGSYNAIPTTDVTEDYSEDEPKFSLTAGIKLSYEDIIYICSECGQEYSFTKMCNCHKYLNGDTYNLDKLITGSNSDGTVTDGNASIISDNEIKCGLCKTALTLDNLLTAHFYTDGAGNYVCEECFNKYYDTLSDTEDYYTSSYSARVQMDYDWNFGGALDSIGWSGVPTSGVKAVSLFSVSVADTGLSGLDDMQAMVNEITGDTSTNSIENMSSDEIRNLSLDGVKDLCKEILALFGIDPDALKSIYLTEAEEEPDWSDEQLKSYQKQIADKVEQQENGEAVDYTALAVQMLADLGITYDDGTESDSDSTETEKDLSALTEWLKEQGAASGNSGLSASDNSANIDSSGSSTDSILGNITDTDQDSKSIQDILDELESLLDPYVSDSGSNVEKIFDTAEYDEIVNKVFATWPSDRSIWTSKMVETYNDFVNSYNTDEIFKAVLNDMDAYGVFSSGIDAETVLGLMDEYIANLQNPTTSTSLDDSVVVNVTLDVGNYERTNITGSYKQLGIVTVEVTDYNTGELIRTINNKAGNSLSWIANKIGTFKAVSSVAVNQFDWCVYVYTASLSATVILPDGTTQDLISSKDITRVKTDIPGLTEVQNTDASTTLDLYTFKIIVTADPLNTNQLEYYDIERIQ